MKRRNPYLLVGLAIALMAYLVLTRPHETLETAVKIADEHGGGKVPAGATKVKYGVGDKWTYKDAKAGDTIMCSNQVFGDPAPGQGKACYAVTITPDTASANPAASPLGLGANSAPPCKVSELSEGLWAHKGVIGPPERFKHHSNHTTKTAIECGDKCCSDKDCSAFVYFKPDNVCWIYHDDPKKLESETKVHTAEAFQKGTVDRSGGMNDIMNSISGGVNETINESYKVLSSGLSGGAIAGIVIAVLAVGIVITVYALKFAGFKFPGTSAPIGNPVTRMNVPVAVAK